MRKLSLLLIAIFSFYGITHISNDDKPVVHEWNIEDSKAYAKDSLMAWQQKQYLCLEKLWAKESNWRPHAYNKHKVMGKNAGGIPQLLGMSVNLPPTLQIDRGLHYIMERYGTPCNAWAFHKKKGWY